jgi:hypothetical protein
VLGLTVLLIWVDTAQPATQISTCGQTCTTDCELANDILCDATVAWGVRLSNGADLDLRGHKLQCSGCDPYAAGVLVDSTSNLSVITNGGTPDLGQILGPWDVGVDCQHASGSRVIGIHVVGSYNVGITNCRKVDGNVVVDVAGSGIANDNIAGPDYIRDNLVKGGVTGIAVGGSGSADIEYNVIVRTSLFGIEISQASSTSLAVRGNVFFHGAGPTNVINGTSNHIFSGNVCDNSVSWCVTCINAGKCTPYTAPFTGP